MKNSPTYFVNTEVDTADITRRYILQNRSRQEILGENRMTMHLPFQTLASIVSQIPTSCALLARSL